MHSRSSPKAQPAQTRCKFTSRGLNVKASPRTSVADLLVAFRAVRRDRGHCCPKLHWATWASQKAAVDFSGLALSECEFPVSAARYQGQTTSP